MKVIKYNLTSDGKIPSFVVDGGYFPKKNNKKSPEDLDLIGISKNSDGLKHFKKKDTLVTYLDFAKNFKNLDGTKYNINTMVDIIFTKVINVG